MVQHWSPSNGVVPPGQHGWSKWCIRFSGNGALSNENLDLVHFQIHMKFLRYLDVAILGSTWFFNFHTQHAKEVTILHKNQQTQRKLCYLVPEMNMNCKNRTFSKF